jgi:hypothetical protein
MNVTPAANHLNILDPSKLLVSTETGGSLQPIENADAFSSSAVFDPSYRYATIQKDGKTIATVYKSGFVEAGNGYGLPNDLTMDGEGLALANKRIEQLLKLYGGHVEYIQDTRTQAASATAATLFAAQQAGQKP